MVLVPYVDNINLTTLYRNLIIAAVIIIISFLIFCASWIRSPFLVIKTLHRELHTKNPFYFLFLVAKVSFQTRDSIFWLKNISLEGYTYILFLHMQIKILLYYVIIVYVTIGLYQLWKLLITIEDKQSSNILYITEVFLNSDIYIFYMVLLLTVLTLVELNKFQKRIRFHYQYFNTVFPGEDKGLLYLQRRTCLLKAKNIILESEEALLSRIN